MTKASPVSKTVYYDIYINPNLTQINVIECYKRIDTKSNERGSHDTQHITILQLIGTYDVALFEDHQSDDKHLQKVHPRRLQSCLGAA